MARIRTRPPLFRSKKTQTTTNSTRRNVSNDSLNGHDSSDGNFLLDSYKTGFKSTQQLSLDFSQFSNHTFFSPARAKVDVALHKIINQYPFTGTLADVDSFMASLTGFEKYVFDLIPKNTGFLYFSGTQVGETTGGTHIRVSPFSGKEFYEAPGSSGNLSLVIGQSPFEIETYLYIPGIQNSNQIIAQRLQSAAGITLALSESASTSDCKILFLVSSASDAYVVASGTIDKGNFSHVRACLFGDDGGKRAFIYVNENLIASSSDIQDFGYIQFDTASLDIGSGSSHTILDYTFTPTQTLSGALDEFRLFTDQRSDEDVLLEKDKQIFASASLQLYFRFDEPSGSYSMNDVLLDQSGHCLHSVINNYNQALRTSGSITNPLLFQNSYYSPVLYPDYEPFDDIIADLLLSASSYDSENPNVVTNLVPRHYLVESAQAVGLPNFDSGIGIAPTLLHVPGTGNLPNSSPLMRILSSISIPLDEIKQFIDSMSTLLSIEPGDEQKISSQMIRYASEYFGIDLPNFFAKSSTDQFSFGQDVVNEYLTTYTLRSLRDELWRRILGTMPYINSSKGTKGAVRSILLAAGIVPENFFTIREFGMSGESRLSDLRDSAIEVTSMFDFSGSIATPTGSNILGGFKADSARIISPYLSGTRTEVGYPAPQGTFVDKINFSPHGISNNPDDGLFTSGSFSIEASYVFDKKRTHTKDQSLFRLISTGSTSPYTYLVSNLIYNHKSENSSSLVFAIRSSAEAPGVLPDPLVLALTGVDLFDGDRWTVGVERVRGDSLGFISSSYTLRCAKQVGNTLNFFSTSSFYSEYSVTPGTDILCNLNQQYNGSGSYIAIGSQSFNSSNKFLNSQLSYVSSSFTGKISHIRFYSSAVGDESFIEHARNFASNGLKDPEFGLGFDLVQTGAFERMRIDATCDQATTSSDSAGNIRIFDFSQNSLHLSGSGFGSSNQIIKPYLSTVNRISPRFDLQQVSNKVRVRGLNNPTKADPQYVISGPAYEIFEVNEIIDDIRFSIEHSIVKALNEDIVSTIGDSQYLDNAMGQPIELFNQTYSKLDHFSNVYFNRLTGKPDFMRTYDVFRWVDVALTDLVESILPKRTKFMGINYIIEPHVLERGKIVYNSYESFMATAENYGWEIEGGLLIP